MTYQETLAYLYNSAPLFQHVGKAAYKEGLENTPELLVWMSEIFVECQCVF